MSALDMHSRKHFNLVQTDFKISFNIELNFIHKLIENIHIEKTAKAKLLLKWYILWASNSNVVHL